MYCSFRNELDYAGYVFTGSLFSELYSEYWDYEDKTKSGKGQEGTFQCTSNDNQRYDDG